MADTPPVRCSACFGQYVDRDHVDFEASWDGPVVEGGYIGENGLESNIRVSIDELVLCENCVRDAAALVGFGDVEKLSAELAQKDQQLADMETRLRNAGSEVMALKTALGIEKEHGPPPARRGRPPKVEA
jgi:hypothetical protein